MSCVKRRPAQMELRAQKAQGATHRMELAPGQTTLELSKSAVGRKSEPAHTGGLLESSCAEQPDKRPDPVGIGRH